MLFKKYVSMYQTMKITKSFLELVWGKRNKKFGRMIPRICWNFKALITRINLKSNLPLKSFLLIEEILEK